MKKEADLILHNATLYTVDSAFSTAESIAIRNGKVLATGSNREILDQYVSVNQADMTGKFIYPGFIDAHCHFCSYGHKLLHTADLDGTKSFEEVLQRLMEHYREHPSEWLQGRGWDQNDWPVKEFPDNARLDSLFPGVAVYIRRVDGHAALASSEALRRAGITPEMKISGGEVEVKDGKMTGILIDNAMDRVSAVIPSPDQQEQVNALLAAQENCLAAGLTAVVDAGLDKDIIGLIDSLQQSLRLMIRLDAMLSPGEDNLQAYFPGGIYRTERLRVGSVKLYADGALGSRGACLLEPYSDSPGKTGLMVTDPAFFREMCQRAYNSGYQVNTHAIGDSAVRFVLNVYASFLQGKNDRRWRIEHAQIVHPDDFALFGAHSIIPSIQATHATSDMTWAVERVGAERIKGAYAYQRLLGENGWLPNGTDFPIESIDPLHTFYASVERKDHQGYPPEGFQMENALTREQALRSVTIWAARGSFWENEIGSLEPGKWADMVVLDRDITTCPGQDLLRTQVLKTFIAGEEVYAAD
ncbi:MAG TPA: amidohydrolase [Bacteroidales bacterium]|nr:amidohydrolase [Bacteroidales bacterium]HNS47422.1 amidohydrolase [Bacteroidales bacterium]